MPSLFPEQDCPEGFETKSRDPAGSSTKVMLANITSEVPLPPKQKPSHFESMSSSLGNALPQLPMSPEGASVKQKISFLEEGVNRQNYRNEVMGSAVSALGADNDELRKRMSARASKYEEELNGNLAVLIKDLDARFDAQAETNDRTNKKIRVLQSEKNQLQRKPGVVLKRLQALEVELDIEPNPDDES
jgi:hypothetical protein